MTRYISQFIVRKSRHKLAAIAAAALSLAIIAGSGNAQASTHDLAPAGDDLQLRAYTGELVTISETQIYGTDRTDWPTQRNHRIADADAGKITVRRMHLYREYDITARETGTYRVRFTFDFADGTTVQKTVAIVARPLPAPSDYDFAGNKPKNLGIFNHGCAGGDFAHAHHVSVTGQDGRWPTYISPIWEYKTPSSNGWVSVLQSKQIQYHDSHFPPADTAHFYVMTNEKIRFRNLSLHSKYRSTPLLRLNRTPCGAQ